jgi:hypothetical protein
MNEFYKQALFYELDLSKRDKNILINLENVR